jgi:hypothetical protein
MIVVTQLLENSIEELELLCTGVEDKSDFDYLKRFTKLLFLQIRFVRNKANLTQCVEIIRNVPLLETLHVNFPHVYHEVNQSKWDDKLMMNTTPFTQLKTLKLNEFHPTGDKEIAFFMEKFTYVQNLSVTATSITLSDCSYYWLELASTSTVTKFSNYKSMRVSFKKDPRLDTLLNSPSQPGQFVKNLSFLDSFGAPLEQDLNIGDPNSDLLHLLIKRCPKIANVTLHFFGCKKEREERHLLTALGNTNI